MSTLPYRLLLTVMPCLSSYSLPAQSIKPKIYIDARGIRYTQQQFDSIGIANMDRPIVAQKEIQKDDETQIRFDIATRDALSLFKEKWIGKQFPSFSLNDVHGNLHSNTSLKGKLLVVDFWSIGCEACLVGMSTLSHSLNRFRHKDIVFMAPAPESARQIQQVLRNRTFSFTSLPRAQGLFSALGIEGHPTYFIVSKTGIILDIYTGALTTVPGYDPIVDDRLVEAIDKALNNQ